MRTRALSLLSAWMLLAPLVPGGAPAEWPRFHGPLVDNRSPDTGLLEEWPEGGPPLALTITGIGEGYSSPAISAGKLFITGIDGDGKQRISAFDLAGKKLWHADNGPGWTAKNLWPGARSTPTVAGGRVFVTSGHGRVGCFDAETGKSLWSVSMIEQLRGTLPRWGYAESLLVIGERVFCTPGGAQGALAALDVKTGKLLWRSKACMDPASYCAPMSFEFEGLTHVATMTGEGAVAVDPATGAVLWSHPHRNRNRVLATPITFFEGKIYGVAGYGKGGFLAKLEKAPEGFQVKPLWTDESLDDQMGGVVLHEGHIYGCRHQSKAKGWLCLDWGTGKILYDEPGIGKGALTYADGMFYCTSETTGVVALVHPDPKGFRVASQFTIPGDITRSTPFWAHPVVIGGRLYLRFGETLYVHDVRRKAPPAPPARRI